MPFTLLVDTACPSQRHHRRLVKSKSSKEEGKEITTGRRLNHRAASLPLFDEAEKAEPIWESQRVIPEMKRPGHTVRAKGWAGRTSTEKQAKWCRGYRTEKRKPPL